MSVVANPSAMEEDRMSVENEKVVWYFTLQRESPIPSDEDDESIYTMQGHETEFAHDTSDTSSSTNTWVSSSENEACLNIEYELDSRSDNENQLMEISSTSEPENNLSINFINVGDSEDLADGSNDSESSFDSDIRRAKFWWCIQCKNLNTNPLFRYCRKCYQLRKTCYPRYEAKRKRRNVTKKLKPIQSSSSMFPKEQRSRRGESSNGMGSSDQQMQDSENLCLICTSKPKNGAFVHGKITHICCCYSCAMKAWVTNSSRCPICNRKVSQILKVFYA